LIKKYDLNAIFVSGPGHGAPAVLSNAYLEGRYSEVYPDMSQDLAGMQRFFKQFSFPGGIGSHATPETPGSIHEGGELGYSISHAYGTVYYHPDLITLTMEGDGESETGPLATSWHRNDAVGRGATPFWVVNFVTSVSQGSSSLATLGFGAESQYKGIVSQNPARVTRNEKPWVHVQRPSSTQRGWGTYGHLAAGG
jgi:hypothetical protein